jgi:hypothetical protein
MSVKDLMVQAPKLCGAFHAEKHAKVAELVWHHEKEKNGFPRTDGEDAYDRIAFLFDWDCDDFNKRDYCISLALLNVLAHYGKEHGDKESAERAEQLAKDLAVDEINYPDVASALTVEAAARGWWDA